MINRVIEGIAKREALDRIREVGNRLIELVIE
jgi:hypothetical protein